VAVLLLASAMAGCARPAPSDAQAPEDDPGHDHEALMWLEQMDQAPIRTSMVRLDRIAYERRVESRQFNSAGREIATSMRTVRHAGPPGARRAEVIAQTSEGSFEFGFAGRLAPSLPPPDAPPELVPHILPEEPSYLAPRHRDAYDFQMAPDTMVAGLPLLVVDVILRGEVSGARSLRYVRHFIEPQSRALVGIRVERESSTLLFQEVSTVAFMMQPHASQWLPDRTSAETQIRLGLGPRRSFETVTSFHVLEVEGGPASL
jgi:hypothetical protein